MATQILTEGEIEDILRERKPISSHQVSLLKSPTRVKNKLQRHCNVHLDGEDGRKYTISVRQSIKNEFDFTVILFLKRRNGRKIILRCNGHHAEHTNRLEKTKIPADTCHIHLITERYQESGGSGEGYAFATDKYRDLRGAVEYLVWAFGIYVFDDKYRGGLFVER